MAKRTGEETRALLLRIGMRMVMERGATAGVQHIRLQEVLRAAGLTTGAAYRLWADQTAYQRDLAIAIVQHRMSPPGEHQQRALQELPPERRTMDEVMRVAGESHVRSIAGDGDRPDSRIFLIALALRTTAGHDPELSAAARGRHEESVREFSALYGGLMRTHGLRMRTPYTLSDFTEAMAALGEGFAVRHAQGMHHPEYDIAEDDEGPSGAWTLFGIGIRALVREFMVPVEGTWD